MSLLRAPTVHFAALGVALLLVKGLVLPDHAARRPLLITAGRVAQLRAEFERSTGHLPEPRDQRVLVDRAVDEEILYREALSRGLDQYDSSIAFRLTEKMRFIADAEATEGDPIDIGLYRQARDLGLDVNDPIVRRIAVQKMRLLLARQADLEAPTDAELRAYYDLHRQEYAQSARVTLWHVLIDPDADPIEMLARLRRENTLPAAVRLGRPSPLGPHLRAQSAHDLTKVFGAEFAATVAGLDPGRWQGPLRSVHGQHLVWVEATRAERIPRFETVRSRVLAECRAARRKQRLQAELKSLRGRYVVHVEEPGEERSS